MTPLQKACVGFVNQVNDLIAAPDRLDVAEVFAHVEIESGWRVAVRSYDGLGSLGLMQVLPGTARWVGVTEPQDEPYYSIKAGMFYMVRCRRELAAAGHRSIEAYAQAYNVGARGYIRGRRNTVYLGRWLLAHALWVDQLAPRDGAMSVPV